MAIKDIIDLMDYGSPVGVSFTKNADSLKSDRLFCELVQEARLGETIAFSEQSCPAGGYVLGMEVPRPDDYYFRSGRYKTRAAAVMASKSLPRLTGRYDCITLFPLKDDFKEFDVMLLFLTPIKAMRIIQACAYHDGLPVEFRSGGTASVCGDCTAGPLNTRRLCMSLGCKGSRKHSKYGDNEIIVGIPYDLVFVIQKGLATIPEIFD